MAHLIPHAPLAEKAILSLILQDPSKWFPQSIGDGIGADHFHQHHKLYNLLSDRFHAGRSLDMVSIFSDEGPSGNLDPFGGPSGIADIFTYSPNGGYYTSHALILRETLARRRGYVASVALGEINHTTAPDEVVRLVKDAMEGVSSALSSPVGMSSAKNASKAFIEALEAAFTNGDLPGESTGIEIIDRITGGMRKGEVWVVTAETSGGKSVLMYQIGAHFANNGKRVLIFTIEMMAPEVIGRIVSNHGNIDYGHITQPRTATRESLAKIKQAVQEISDWKLWIEDRGSQNTSLIHSESVKHRDMDGPIDLIIIDYLQIIEGDRGRNESRQQELSRISKELKKLGKLLQCPVLTASQLNDDGKIREARDVGFDADAVFYIGEDGIKVAKLRNAQRGQVLPLRLNGALQRFIPFTPEETPKPEIPPRRSRRY